MIDLENLTRFLFARAKVSYEENIRNMVFIKNY